MCSVKSKQGCGWPRARAESEASHVCSSMCDGELATTGYSFWSWYRFAWWYLSFCAQRSWNNRLASLICTRFGSNRFAVCMHTKLLLAQTKRNPLHSLFFPIGRSFTWNVINTAIAGWVVSWVVSIEHPWMPNSIYRQPAGHFSCINTVCVMRRCGASDKSLAIFRCCGDTSCTFRSWGPDNPQTWFANHGLCILEAASEDDSSSCFCWLDPCLAWIVT